MKAKCDDVDDVHVLMSKSDNDGDSCLIFVHLYHICRDK